MYVLTHSLKLHKELAQMYLYLYSLCLSLSLSLSLSSRDYGMVGLQDCDRDMLGDDGALFIALRMYYFASSACIRSTHCYSTDACHDIG
mmetsp:Transcript_2237/g.6193  ORF Transcript_2237/g.6193 Transcript_2237/m.6193 type:complete len:89 (+) Transcript_2237:182-448(+)